MRKPRLLSLCSGIGGIDLAAEWAGWEVTGQCELDPFCQAVLAKHWPGVPHVADIRDVDGASYGGPIDLIAGGIPCQPFSVAGKRGGAFDPRHLWPEMRRIVEIYQPAFVLVENVAGFIGMALDDVLTDLATDGYEAGAVVLPAAAVGAPHQRERVFVVAHAYHDSGRRAQRAEHRDMGSATRADAGGEGHTQRPAAECGGEDVADTAGARLPLTRPSGQPANAAEDDTGMESEPERRGGGQAQSRMGRAADGIPGGLDCGGLPDASGDTRADQEGAGGGDGRRRGRTQTPEETPRPCWPAGPGEAQHEWEPPRVTQARIPHRAARLKALGNAVVPQQVYPILAAMAAEWMKESV